MAQNSPMRHTTIVAMGIPFAFAGLFCLGLAGGLMLIEPRGNIYAAVGFTAGIGAGLCTFASVLAFDRLVHYLR